MHYSFLSSSNTKAFRDGVCSGVFNLEYTVFAGSFSPFHSLLHNKFVIVWKKNNVMCESD